MTAAKGVHSNYNEYKEFHERVVEAHICASFMQMLGMTKLDSKLASNVVGRMKMKLTNSF